MSVGHLKACTRVRVAGLQVCRLPKGEGCRFKRSHVSRSPQLFKEDIAVGVAGLQVCEFIS